LTFELPASVDRDALKIVGRWFSVSTLRFAQAAATVGPFVPTRAPNGSVLNGAVLASPNDHAEHVLIVTCELIPPLNSDPEVLIFYGGFDAREVMDDTTKEAGFLGFLYPAANPEDLKRRVGTIDLV
jgi:hypothetical protein